MQINFSFAMYLRYKTELGVSNLITDTVIYTTESKLTKFNKRKKNILRNEPS